MIDWLTQTDAIPRYVMLTFIAIICAAMALNSVALRLSHLWRDLYLKADAFNDELIAELDGKSPPPTAEDTP